MGNSISLWDVTPSTPECLGTTEETPENLIHIYTQQAVEQQNGNLCWVVYINSKIKKA